MKKESEENVGPDGLMQEKDRVGNLPHRRSREILLSPNQKMNRVTEDELVSNEDDHVVEREHIEDPDRSIISDSEGGTISTIVRLSHEFFKQNNLEVGKLLADILSVEDLEYRKKGYRDADHQPDGSNTSANVDDNLNSLKDLIEFHEEDEIEWSESRSKGKDGKHTTSVREILDRLSLMVWKRMAEYSNDPKSMIRTGLSYYKGKGTAINIEEALRYWKLAANLGDDAANMLLARHYQKEMLERGANNSKSRTPDKHKEVQYNVGSQNDSEDNDTILSDDNSDSSFNLKDFLRYTVIAASQDDAQSLRTLGLVYQDGLFGIKPSPRRALKMYLKAAEKNETFSMFRAAEIYYYGAENVPSDRKAALEIFSKAAEAAPIPNWENLGNLYRFGVGAPDDKPDILNCIRCYQKAIEAGSLSALKALADVCWNIFVNNNDLSVDSAEKMNLTIKNTFEYYERAAKSGELGAMMGLARCYWRGVGVEKSEEKCKQVLEQVVQKLEEEGRKVIFDTDNDQDIMSLIVETDILDE